MAIRSCVTDDAGKIIEVSNCISNNTVVALTKKQAIEILKSLKGIERVLQDAIREGEKMK